MHYVFTAYNGTEEIFSFQKENFRISQRVTMATMKPPYPAASCPAAEPYKVILWPLENLDSLKPLAPTTAKLTASLLGLDWLYSAISSPGQMEYPMTWNLH